MSKRYMTDLRLGQIDLSLTDRDRQILKTIKQLRFLRTSQIQHLFFTNHSTPRAELTATTKKLHRLKNIGLIDHLDRRSASLRSGSSAMIWFLTEGGARLLDLGTGAEHKRVNRPDVSSVFLKHTLAVAECYTQIKSICSSAPDINLKRIDTEPLCWRAYKKDGKEYSLRPDLYVEISGKGYEDHWFIEMDLDTESTSDIADKCRRYQQYCQAGDEQRSNGGLFPLVLWIVPTEDRRQKMIDAIRLAFGNRYPHINYVIIPDTLKQTILEGAKEADLC